MTSGGGDADPFDALVEEFLGRVRAGEAPDPTEYARRHPELAEDIRDLFPALMRLEGAAPEATPEPFRMPERIGEYTILREIGRGGMGVVYEAEQRSLSRHVALKVLPGARALDPARLGRFLLEARSAARLHHSHIVPVFGSGEADGTCYYAMQFIRGQPLNQVMREVRRLRSRQPGARAAPAATRDAASAAGLAESFFGSSGLLLLHTADGADGAESGTPDPSSTSSAMASGRAADYFRNVARIGLQVGEALSYAHGEGVLHRDIKPANLILDLHGDVWVTDFGLAKSRGSADLTEAGDVVGTLRYLAPERFKGASDERTDVYSLGVTLYELCAGEPPFDGADREVLTRQVLRCAPVRLRRRVPTVPRDLDTIVHKAMAAAPGDRYPSARALVEDLRRFLEVRPIRARRASPAGRLWRWCRRHPGTASCLAVIGLLLVAVAGLAASSARDLRRERNVALDALAEAQLREARAARRTEAPGQRTQSLAALRAAIARLPDRRRRGADLRDHERALREEAIAAVSLVDVEELARHEGLRVHDAALRRFARARQGVLEIRDAPGGTRRLHALPLPAGEALAPLAFTPEGDHVLAEWTEDGLRSTALLALASGARVFHAHGRAAPRVAFDGRGRVAVSTLDPGAPGLRLLALGDGAELAAVPLDGEVSAVAFEPGGAHLAVGVRSRDGPRVLVLDGEDPGRVRQEIAVPSGVRALAWDPGGPRLAIADRDRTVRLWDVTTGRALAVLLAPPETNGLVFSPDGLVLAITDWRSTHLWDPRSGLHLLSCPGRLRAFSPDGDRAVFDSADGGGVWRIHRNRVFRTLRHPGERNAIPRVVRASPRGGAWALASQRRGLLLRAPGTDASRRRDAGYLQSLDFDPEDASLWSAGSTGLLHWTPAPGPGAPRAAGATSEAALDAAPRRIDEGYFFDVAATPRRIATLDARGVNLHEPDGERWRRIELGPHPRARFLSLSPGGRWVASGTWHGTGVRLWDAEARRRVRTFESGTARPTFSPCGRWLAIASAGAVELLGVDDWKPRARLARSALDAAPGSCAFTSRGDHLAYAVSNTRVRIVALPETDRATDLPDVESGIVSMAFSPDDRRLFVVNGDGVAREWDLVALAHELRDLELAWRGPPSAPGRSR